MLQILSIWQRNIPWGHSLYSWVQIIKRIRLHYIGYYLGSNSTHWIPILYSNQSVCLFNTFLYGLSVHGSNCPQVNNLYIYIEISFQNLSCLQSHSNHSWKGNHCAVIAFFHNSCFSYWHNEFWIPKVILHLKLSRIHELVF